MKLVAATGNQGKLRELRSLLTGYELLSQSELGIGGAEETGSTFVENAILKARHAADASSLPALADDSGLEVPALAGAPGIYSARFAGPGATDADNCNCLLDKLGDNTDRRARFRCVLVVMRHALDPAPLICQGSWQGEIAAAIAGSNGFGYDPLFIPDGFDCTAAELDAAVKNELSHRGQALQELLARLPAFLADK